MQGKTKPTAVLDLLDGVLPLHKAEQKPDAKAKPAAKKVRKIAPVKVEPTEAADHKALLDNLSKENKTRENKYRNNEYLRKYNIEPSEKHQLDLIFGEPIGLVSNLVHMPNDYARSSLFSAANHRAARKQYMNEILFHYSDDIKIRYTGTELRARDDELVWLVVMKYGEKTPLGESFRFNLKDLIKDCGWSRNASYYKMARESLLRLRSATLMLQNSAAYGISPTMNLIADLTEFNDGDGQPDYYHAELDKNLILLYANRTFTHHYLDAYSSLSPVARRLADYIRSHKKPFSLSVIRFMSMCGCQSTMGNWLRTVERACEEVVASKIAVSCRVRKAWGKTAMIDIIR